MDSKDTSQDWVDEKKIKACPNLIFKMGRYSSIPHKNHKRYIFGRGSNLELLINLNYLIGLPRPADYLCTALAIGHYLIMYEQIMVWHCFNINNVSIHYVNIV